jgi:hypothetical protein
MQPTSYHGVVEKLRGDNMGKDGEQIPAIIPS